MMPFAVTWMIILSEITQRKTYITYMWSQKKNDTNELIYKKKQTHRYGEQTCGCQWGEDGWVRDGLGVWD